MVLGRKFENIQTAYGTAAEKTHLTNGNTFSVNTCLKFQTAITRKRSMVPKNFGVHGNSSKTTSLSFCKVTASVILTLTSSINLLT